MQEVGKARHKVLEALNSGSDTALFPKARNGPDITMAAARALSFGSETLGYIVLAYLSAA